MDKRIIILSVVFKDNWVNKYRNNTIINWAYDVFEKESGTHPLLSRGAKA